MEKYLENEENVTEAISAFDTLYTTNHMKILKILFPYLEQKHKTKLAIFIKWQELIFTLNFFKHNSNCFYNNDLNIKKTWDLNTLLPLVTSYCNESEKAIVLQFSQLQNTMKMMNEMQQYMPMIQQFISSMSTNKDESAGLDGFADANMIDLLKNMMSEEQQTMFAMFMNGG